MRLQLTGVTMHTRAFVFKRARPPARSLALQTNAHKRTHWKYVGKAPGGRNRRPAFDAPKLLVCALHCSASTSDTSDALNKHPIAIGINLKIQ